MSNQLYLFGGQNNLLPKHISPLRAQKLAQQHKPKTGFLHTCMPEITPSYLPKWTDKQADNLLRKYVLYVAAIAKRRHWRAGKNVTKRILVCLNLMTELTEAIDVDISITNAIGKPVHEHETVAKQKLSEAIQAARKAMIGAMGHLYQATDKALLLEPLFYLLFWDKQVRDYFVQQTDLYVDARKKYPLLWRRYKYYPRLFKGMGIRRIGELWQTILPHTWPQVRDKETGQLKQPHRWRTPIVRASFGVKKLTAAQRRQLLKTHFPVYKQEKTTSSPPF